MFYLQQIRPVLKYCKVRKYCDQDCLKIFSFALYTSNGDSNFWKKYSFGSKKLVLTKKPPISKVGSFLKSNFDFNQISKIVLRQIH